MTEKPRILYVDDEENNLVALKATFRRDYSITTATSGQEALDFLKNETVNVIISDQRMPGMSGVEFLQQAKKVAPSPIRILLTGYADINAVIDAINKGEVYRYVQKPWDEDDLRFIINSAYELFDLRQKNGELTDKLKKVNKQLEFLLRQNLIS